jgi:polyphosphate kinase
MTEQIDILTELEKPIYYNNRELSWLDFNERVLQEAEDEQNPLLERLKYLAIFSSNLDEFFMVRVAGLQDQVRVNFQKPENKAGLTPKEQLSRVSEVTQKLVARQTAIYKKLVEQQLLKEKVCVQSFNQLSSSEKKFAKTYFEEQVFPVLTPVAVDAYRPFPTLLNKTMNVMVLLEKSQHNELVEKMAIVQVPSVLPRFVNIPTNDGKTILIYLEDLIIQQINQLFFGYQVKSVSTFRMTRNADLTIHEEGARDLLVEIEKELKKRKWGAASRLEVRKNEIDPHVLQYLLNELEVHKNDVYEVNCPIDLTCLFSFVKEVSVGREHLEFESFIPQPSFDLTSEESIFDKAMQQDLFFHHPYESFAPIVDFVTEAADDSNVLAIKQTLYRVSGNSPVIQALKRAAEKGKQVTVLVELKARFDEENNVHWAKELEQAGCLVIYGMNNLKTHSKITLVVRSRNGQIERFVHLGTGNYNDQTAKVYTDMSIITTNKKFGIDATNFFNYLSGYTEKPKFHYLVMAPFTIRDEFVRLIDKEIEFHEQHGDGYIHLKMNSLTDKELIIKMYEASIAGVKIDLIVRGICCLRPQIKGVSENIRVVSIVGRFLEHSRIFYFHHHGKKLLYLSSADLMTRNMIKRVELLFPILDVGIKKRILDVLDLHMKDTMKAREQNEQGQYKAIKTKKNECAFNSQEELLKLTYRVNHDGE